MRSKDLSIFILSAAGATAWSVVLFIESLQMRAPGLRRLGGLALTFVALCLAGYVLLQYLYPLFGKLSARQRGLSLLFGGLFAGLLLLMIPVATDKFFYLLSPTHTLVISAQGGLPEQVQILQFNTAAGGLDPAASFKRLAGGLTWQGRVGDQAVLAFKPSASPLLITVDWDGHPQSVELASTTKREAIFVNQQFPIAGGQRLLWLACVWLALTWVTWAAAVLLVSVRLKPAAGRVAWVWYAVPMLGVWLVYLLTFWPGLISPDSLMQWTEVQSGQFSDAHPAIHSLLIWLLARLWNTPAILVIFHILLLGLLVAWGLGQLQKRGLPPPVLWAGALLFAFFPLNGLLVNSVWKDITYACALFAFFLQFVAIYFSEGDWLKSNWNLAGLVLSGLAAAFVRHNGLPVVLASLAVLLWVYRSAWRRILVAAVLFLALWAGIRGPLYSALHVKLYPGFTNILFLDHIDAHLHAGTRLLPDEQAFLETLLPLQDWPYDCADSDIRKMDGPIPFDYFTQASSEPARIAVNLFLRDPLVDIQHTLCASSLVWKINTGHYISIVALGRSNDGVYHWVVENDLGLAEHSLLPGLVPLLSNQFSEKGLLAKPAFYLLICLFVFVVVALRRRSARLLVIAVPLLAQTGVMLLVTYAQDFRYLYSTLLMALFCLLLLFLPEEQVEPVECGANFRGLNVRNGN